MTKRVLTSRLATLILLICLVFTIHSSKQHGASLLAQESQDIIYFVGDNVVQSESIDVANALHGLDVYEASHWSDVIQQVQGGQVKAVIVNSASIEQVSSPEASQIFLNSITFAGLDVDGFELAEAVELPVLYTSMWGSPVSQSTAHVPEYYIYSLSAEGVQENAIDIDRYLYLLNQTDPESLEELGKILENVVPPFSIRTKRTTDVLNADNELPFSQALQNHIESVDEASEDSHEIFLPAVGN